jgi:hypothetical protein
MKDCPGSDALTTIASALDWDVDSGLRHLSTCTDCAQQLRSVESTHAAYDERVAVPERVVSAITNRLSQEAALESARGQKTQSIGNVIEALLAGGTAVTVLNTGGLSTPPTLTVTVFAIVATSLFSYRVFRSSHASTSANSSSAIQ